MNGQFLRPGVATLQKRHDPEALDRVLAGNTCPERMSQVEQQVQALEFSIDSAMKTFMELNERCHIILMPEPPSAAANGVGIEVPPVAPLADRLRSAVSGVDNLTNAMRYMLQRIEL